jgi:hypothetical protein
MSDIKIKYQKLIKVGNSYAVTLDSEFVRRHHLKVGEPMTATYKTDQSVVSFVPTDQPELVKAITQSTLSKTEKTSKLASTVTPELEEWMNDFYTENREAMEILSKLP